MKIKVNVKWLIQIIVISFTVSVVFTFASSEIMSSAGYVTAFAVLAVFIAIGVIFDLIGVAVTTAVPAPFHSMASHRERGAAEALKLIKNAEKVASICNDVVGDISGIVSGSTSAIIAAKLVQNLSAGNILIQLVMSGFVAALTIGGKALGKTLAINSSTTIVLYVGKLMNLKNRIFHSKRGK